LIQIIKNILKKTPFEPTHMGDYIRSLYFWKHIRTIPVETFMTILDAGCGDGNYAIKMAFKFPHIKIIGVDKDIQGTPRRFPSNVIFIKEDLLKLVASETYDFIYSIDVIEHIPDNIRVIQRCYDALRSGGYLYLHTPNKNSGKHIFSDRHFNTFDQWESKEHVGEMYTIDELKSILKKTGFEIIKTQYTFGFLGQLAWELDRLSDGKKFSKIMIMPFIKVLGQMAVRLNVQYGDLLMLAKKTVRNILLNEPLVTIIITAYNRANLIGEAIEGVLNQSYSNFKIVIVDDGSTDNIIEVCRRYIDRYPQRIVYYRKDNGGCASARNYGLDRIDDASEYVCFLDSDDRYLPDKLKREVELLERSPDSDFCYASSIIYSEEEKKETLNRVAAVGHPDEFAIEHFMTNEAKPGALLYRANILNNKRFDESLLHNEDSEFLQRIAIEHRGVYSPEPSCWVRNHIGSKSRNGVEISKSILRANQKILKMYPDFCHTHSLRVRRRMLQAQKNIFVELMIAKHWREAKIYAHNSGEKLLSYLRLGIYYKARRFFWRKLVRKFIVLKRIGGR